MDEEKPKEYFCIAMEDLSVLFEPLDQIKGISWEVARSLATDVRGPCSSLVEVTLAVHRAYRSSVHPGFTHISTGG